MPPNLAFSLNYVRQTRPQNMLRAWSLPANNGDQAFFDFPQLPSADLDTSKRVEWWNLKLKERIPDVNLKVVAGGQTEYKLSERRSGWLGF